MPMLQKEDSQACNDADQEQGTDAHNIQQQQQDNQHTHGLPAQESQRFPSHEAYICEAIGEWGLKLDRLELTSSIMVNTNRLERRYPRVDTVGELEYQGLKMIHELMQMVADRVDFVSRQQFEARYDLNWQETEEEEHEQTSQQRSTAESSNANHVKRQEAFRRDTSTGSGSTTPPYRSMSSDRSDSTVDLTPNLPN